MGLIIRLEEEKDHREVENLNREAFWNLYKMGCDEHYLVYKLRKHADFVKELNFVAEIDGKIVGNIMYTKSFVVDEKGEKHNTLTFGPLAVLPEYQRKGVGKTLINHTKEIAKRMGYPAIIIYGDYNNYCASGFVSCKRFGITNTEGRFHSALLVLELRNGHLTGISGKFHESEVFDLDEVEVEEFDKQFPFKEKLYSYKQEQFYISSHSYLY